MPVHLVTGHRPGALIFIDGRGYVANGAIDDAGAKALRAAGIATRPYVAPRGEVVMSERETSERQCADAMMGRSVGDDGRTRTDNDIAKRMAEVTKPMRKREVFTQKRRW